MKGRRKRGRLLAEIAGVLAAALVMGAAGCFQIGRLGLPVENMAQRMESGMSYDEVIAWGEENKLKIAHRFTVDDLNYLKAGGRVSNASALVGSILSVKPVLYVPDCGTLEVAQKVRGRKAALRAIVDGVKNDLSQSDPTGVELRILHADCIEDAKYVRDEIRNAFPAVGEIKIIGLGVVIGARCGPVNCSANAAPSGWTMICGLLTLTDRMVYPICCGSIVRLAVSTSGSSGMGYPALLC